MDATDPTGKAARPQRATAPLTQAATAAPTPAGGHPFGPDAAAIAATEHWSLLGTRSLIWNEAMSGTTVFLSVLSAAIVALALVANATGFRSQTATLALVLLPVVLFVGVATHSRLLQINREDVELVLAMNRLRRPTYRSRLKGPAVDPQKKQRSAIGVPNASRIALVGRRSAATTTS
jgi:hypothetical protein